MKTVFLSLYLFLICFLLSACSAQSMEDDARDAAKLTIESMKYAKERKLKKSDEKYKEATLIIEKYKGSDLEKEFYNIYTVQLSN